MTDEIHVMYVWYEGQVEFLQAFEDESEALEALEEEFRETDAEEQNDSDYRYQLGEECYLEVRSVDFAPSTLELDGEAGLE